MATTPVHALMDGYARAHWRYGEVLDTLVARRFLAIGAVNDAAAAAFVDEVAALAGSGRTGVARLASNYLTRQVAMLAGDGHVRTVEVGADALTTPALRDGITDADLWMRPVIRARTELSRGGTWADALARGRASAHEIVHTDVALAQRTATRAALHGDDRVGGYRRVCGWSACKLCALAAQNVYNTANLMPIHGRCRCTVSAVVGARDPGGRRNDVTIDLTGGDVPAGFTIDLSTEIAPSLQEVS